MTIRSVTQIDSGETANKTSTTVTIPAGTAAGDVMLLAMLVNAGSAILTPSGGGVSWSPLHGMDNNQNGNNSQLWIATAVAASAGSTVTVSSNTSCRLVGALIVDTGVTADGVLVALTQTSTSTTSIAFPSLTTTSDGWDVLGIACLRSGTTTAADMSVVPSGVTKDTTVVTAYSTAPQHSVVVCHETTAPAKGTVGPGAGTASVSCTNQNLYTVALAPSAVVSGTISDVYAGTVAVTLYVGSGSAAKAYVGTLQVYGPTPGPPPPPPAAIVTRFPGDTQPKLTRSLLLGVDEYDKNPAVQSGTERCAPEALAGVPVGGIRLYYSGNQQIDTGGSMWAEIAAQHAKGRVPWVSVAYNAAGQWATEAGGASTAVWDRVIAYAEEHLSAPVFFTIIHEPITKVVSRGGSAGTEAQWYAIQTLFRSRMTAYANVHGGVANYKWKNLTFGCVHTAQTFALGSSGGGIDLFVPTPTDGTFDCIAADPYEVKLGMGFWNTPNLNATINWCEHYGLPLAFTEFALQNRDPNAATYLQDFWNHITDGTHDIFAAFYYNSDVNGQIENTWLLDNVSNGGLQDIFVALLQNSKAVHYWDSPRPDGTYYTKPAGL